MLPGFVSLLILDSLQALVCLRLFAQKPQKNVLRYSKLLVVIALICVLSAGAIGAYCLCTAFSWAALILDIVFSLVGGWLLLAYCRWRVTYGDGRFEVRPCLGRRRTYSMADIYGLTEGPSMTTLHLRNGKLRLDNLVRGREDFIEEAEHYYRRVLRKGHALPDIPDELFHGNVREPWSFIVIFLLVDLFMLGCIVFSVVLMHREMHPTDAAVSVALSDYTVQWQDDTLYLNTDGLRQPYYVSHVADILSAEQYSALCGDLSQGVPLRVAVGQENYKKAAEDDCNYIEIRELRRSDGQLLISEEAVIKSIRLDTWPALLFPLCILLLTLCFEGFFCYIVNRARKYPRLFRLLVKEGWRNV